MGLLASARHPVCLLAHAFLVVVRLGARDAQGLWVEVLKGGSRPRPDPAYSSAGGEEADPRHGRTEKTNRRFLLEWSLWRRVHQAVAARCRKASLAAKRAARTTAGTEGPSEAVTIAPEEAHLTDEQWAALV